jgi:hypothetical protein
MKALQVREYISEEVVPYLMDYSVERISCRGCHERAQRRDERRGSLLKGFHLGFKTYLHNMDTFYWAKSVAAKHLVDQDLNC